MKKAGFEPGSFEGAELIQIAVDQVDPNPFQPRRQFDPEEIASLADSLRQHGMLQPILVRAVGLRYQLIAGERRLRASIEAQLHEVPARVLDLDDQRVFELAMVENLQREDLNAIDKATALPRLPVALRRHPGRAGRPAGHRPLDGLEPDPPARAARARSSTPSAPTRSRQGHARALLGLADAETRVVACRRVVAEHLSVRQTEALVSTGVPTPTRPRVRKDPGTWPGCQAPPSPRPRAGAAPPARDDRGGPRPHPGPRPDHHRLSFARGVRSADRASSASEVAPSETAAATSRMPHRLADRRPSRRGDTPRFPFSGQSRFGRESAFPITGRNPCSGRR